VYSNGFRKFFKDFGIDSQSAGSDSESMENGVELMMLENRGRLFAPVNVIVILPV
jgi:hypothetical protein